jgi:glyoxylase-like metal-dependent hydrolase (beta-lactamase superfamily II)
VASRKPEIKAFFDEATFTVSYVVWDAETHDAAVIDPVLDYEPRGGRIATGSADKILAFLAEERLHLSRVLETHAHADHLSAASHIKAKSGARIGIGEHIGQVQETFRALFNAKDVSETGAEFDDLFADGTVISLGGLTSR